MSPCVIRGHRQDSSICFTQHMPQSHNSHTGLQLFWSNKLSNKLVTIFTCQSGSASLNLIVLRIPACNVASMLHNAQVLRVIYFSHSQCHLQFASLMLTTQKFNSLFKQNTSAFRNKAFPIVFPFPAYGDI